MNALPAVPYPAAPPAELTGKAESVCMAVASASNAVVADLAAALVMAHAPELRTWAAESLAERGYHKAAALLCTPAAHAGTAGEVPQSTAPPLAEVRPQETSEYVVLLTAEPQRQTALEAAQELHALGLNVLPQPIGLKGGGRWKGLQFTRLRLEDLPAVFAGRCNVAVMTGRTSGGLFVLDCETPEVFEDVRGALAQKGIPLWAVTTARGGHIYLRSDEGEVKSIPPGRLPDMEVRGQGDKYVLAPPSLHPTGAVYTWLPREGAAPPVVPLATIDFLRDTDGHLVTLEASGKAGSGPRLNRRTRAYIATGRALTEGQRHNAFLYACRNYRDVGMGYEDMTRELAPIALASGLPAAEVESVMTWAEENTEPKARQRLDLPNPAAFAWEGRTARTDYAVFAALVERARLGGYEDGVFRASWRELMALAGIASMDTLRQALRRLKTRQLVERVPGKDERSGAALWRLGRAALTTAECVQAVALYFAPPEDSSATACTHFHPAEQRILAAVQGAAVALRTRQDIARAAGLPLGAVQNALRPEGPLRTTRAITKQGGAWKPGEVDMLAIQERADKAEHKRLKVKRRVGNERARRVALQLIEGRQRGGW